MKVGAYECRTYDVADGCEVVTSWGSEREGRPTEFCGKPTTHFYPAHDGGAMALCAECAKPHGRHAWPVV